jgi:hypothetical protein
MTDFLCSKMRLRKNLSTQRGRFGQFLIRIRIQDSDPDPNPGFESGFESGSDSKLTAGRIRIRNQIRNFCFGSATLQYTLELRRTLKSPRLMKISAHVKKLGAHQKVRRISCAPAYYLGSAESPTAYFLQVWLKNSRSSDVPSRACRPQVI